MIILYGSQTGNAKHVAKLIQNVLLFGYKSDTIYNMKNEKQPFSYTIEMDSFDLSNLLDIKVIIFVCSTHGNGTEPFNMSKFWKIISNKNLPCDFLSHLKVAVFGLGDSSYSSYNYCAKKLFNCLKRLGAQILIRRGCGDSQDKEGFLTDFKLWIKELYLKLKDFKLQDANLFAIKKNIFYEAIVLQKKLLTPIRYEFPAIELKLDINIIDFEIGDCLAVYPENYNYKEFGIYNKINDESFLEYVKTKCDFNSIPQQHFFLQLYCNDHFISEEYKNKAKELYDNYDLYYEYICLPKRTIFEVIKEFKIALSQKFINLNIPTINPRYFTLTKKENCFYVTISLVSYQTAIKDLRKGLCSEYFKTISTGDKLNIDYVTNKILFNSNKILFICTGTGITLPRAFINFKRKAEEVIILYGFRFRNKDFFYEKEFTEKGAKLYCAVSREDKKYVQDIFFQIKEINNIDEWSILVSGNSRLNNIVEKILFDRFNKKVYFQTETW